MIAEEKLNYSQRLVRKGALGEETYQVFQHWDTSCSVRDNIESIRETNPVGALNEAWLREITATLSSRFTHGDGLAPLITLAKGLYPPEKFQFCLLWHFGSTDGLFASFVSEFLYERMIEGVAVMSTEEVMPFVLSLCKNDRLGTKLTEYGLRRTARDLLRMAVAFGLMEGQPRRKFSHTHIPEDAVLYAVYNIMDQLSSADRLVKSERWRLFLMGQDDVKRELLNLHQFHRLHYESAGSVQELNLPFSNLDEFVDSLVT